MHRPSYIGPAALLIILQMTATAEADSLAWSPLDGPDGGFALSLAVSPGDGDVLYLGSDVYGGVYRSGDGGLTWEFKSLVAPAGQIIDIDVSPHSSDAVVAGSVDGVYITDDGGASWIHAGLKDTTVYAVVFDHGDPEVIYAGTLKNDPPFDGHGLFKSIDGGGSWHQSGLEGYPVISILSHPGAPDTLYAGTGAGVFKSFDSGETWSEPLGPWGAVKGLAVDDSGIIFAGTRADLADPGTIYRSGNGGASWDTLFIRNGTIHAIAMDPSAPETLYCAVGDYLEGDEGVLMTTDGGDTWFAVNNGLTDRMVQAAAVCPGDPSKAWLGADGLGGIYRTIDGGSSWTQSNAGLRHTVIQAICFDGAGNLYAASGWGTYSSFPCVSRSPDQGAAWEQLSSFPSAEYLVSVWDISGSREDTDEIYAAGAYHVGGDAEQGMVCRTTGRGSGWEELWLPDSLIVTSVHSVSSTGRTGPAAEVILAGIASSKQNTPYGVYRSADGGQTWDSTSGWEEGNAVWSLSPHPFSAQSVAAASTWGMYLSEDGGLSWERKPASPLQAYVVLFDALTPDTLYLGAGGPFADTGGVHRSIDGGESWSLLGLEEYSICALTGSFGAGGDTLYAGTGGNLLHSPGYGVFRSVDGGSGWEPFNEGMTSPYIMTFEVDPDESGSIYSGTAGGGIYLLDRPSAIVTEPGETSGSESGTSADACVQLSIAPNPFNPITVIRYVLQKESRVCITIYDIAGARLRVLSERIEKPGEHRVIWDGRDERGRITPSGVYICSISAGRDVLRRRMVVVK